VLWTAVVGIGLLEGWWRSPLAARGNTQAFMNALVLRVLLAVVALYRRFVSPALPPACRFHPSCSEYAAEALRAHGPWRGSALALRRLGRCHPFGGSGHDPVPRAQETRS